MGLILILFDLHVNYNSNVHQHVHLVDKDE